MSDEAAQRLAALRAKRTEDGNESVATSTTRARIVVGSISGVGFVAAAAAMGPMLVDSDGGVAEAIGPVDSALKADDTTELGASAELQAPEVEVVSNYIYVDADGNPLSEAEVAALRTEPVELTDQSGAAETAALAPEPDAASETFPAAETPTSTNAPVAGAPTPTATAPPVAPVATAPAATQAPARAAPAPTAAPAPVVTAVPATTAAPDPAPAAAPATTDAPTTAAPAPTTAAPPPTTAQPPPLTTAPPKSGSSG